MILFRIGALGDVVCTLPMCAEIRKRHPERLLIFVTAADYKKMVLLSRVADQVYGAQSWTFSALQHFFGLIEKIYVAKVTGDSTMPGLNAISWTTSGFMRFDHFKFRTAAASFSVG